MTELGEVVNSIMKQAFPSIVDVNFTANLEALLDKVEEGTVNWKTVVRNFYPDLEEAGEKGGQRAGTCEDRGRSHRCDLRQMRHETWSLNTVLTESSWPARASLSAKIPSPIWRRSAWPARNAARISSSARPRRAENITAARTIRNAISCPGRNPPENCVRNAVAMLVEKGNKLVCSGEACNYVENK